MRGLQGRVGHGEAGRGAERYGWLRLVLLTLSFGELNERASSSGLLRLDEVRLVEVGSVMLWYTFSFGELNERASRSGRAW